MLISYYTEIEAARVYGFPLHIYCIPTATTVFLQNTSPFPVSDEDCFTEDNTIPPLSHRSWRIPGTGDRNYRKVESNFYNDQQPQKANVLKKLRIEEELFEQHLHSKNLRPNKFALRYP